MWSEPPPLLSHHASGPSFPFFSFFFPSFAHHHDNGQVDGSPLFSSPGVFNSFFFGSTPPLPPNFLFFPGPEHHPPPLVVRSFAAWMAPFPGHLFSFFGFFFFFSRTLFETPIFLCRFSNPFSFSPPFCFFFFLFWRLLPMHPRNRYCACWRSSHFPPDLFCPSFFANRNAFFSLNTHHNFDARSVCMGSCWGGRRSVAITILEPGPLFLSLFQSFMFVGGDLLFFYLFFFCWGEALLVWFPVFSFPKNSLFLFPVPPFSFVLFSSLCFLCDFLSGRASSFLRGRPPFRVPHSNDILKTLLTLYLQGFSAVSQDWRLRAGLVCLP